MLRIIERALHKSCKMLIRNLTQGICSDNVAKSYDKVWRGCARSAETLHNRVAQPRTRFRGPDCTRLRAGPNLEQGPASGKTLCNLWSDCARLLPYLAQGDHHGQAAQLCARFIRFSTEACAARRPVPVQSESLASESDPPNCMHVVTLYVAPHGVGVTE